MFLSKNKNKDVVFYKGHAGGGETHTQFTWTN